MSDDLNEILETAEAPNEAPEATNEADTGVEKGSPPEPEKDQPDVAALSQQLEELRKEAHGLKYALTDERQKRQLMEQRLGRPQEPDIPDPLDDPKGYRDAIEKRQDERLQSSLLQERLNMSRAFASSTHQDYLQMEQRFAEMAQKDPRLIEAMRNHPNPAEFAYQIAAQEANRKTPEQVEAEQAKKLDELVNQRLREVLGNQIPSAVSDLRATQAPADVGSESLHDILNR